MGLDTWFSRPIKLTEGDITEGLGLFVQFDPWRLWANDVSVRNKLGGYGFFRGNMNVKVVVNASPYQYVQMHMAYKPLTSNSQPSYSTTAVYESLDFSGGSLSRNVDIDIASSSRLMKRTCRWHTKCNLQDGKGLEMALPFVYYDKWLRVDGANIGPFSPGMITLYTIGTLRSCSGTVGSAVEYTVYAWMDNFEMTRATFVAQSYLESNHPAAFTGSSAGTLGVIPTLSGLVRTGAHQMADAAMTALGLTKHSVLREPTPYAELSNAHMAVTDMNAPGNVLAMSSGNGVTVDPSVMQPDSVDQTAFAHILGKAPIVLNFDWGQTSRSGAVLATAWVSPEYGFVSSQNGFNGFPYLSVEHSPHSHVAACFKYWRGPINFHFEVVKTQFHKGRIAVIYEPNSEIAGASIDTRLQVTKIIDISEVSELDFEVDFMANAPWLQVSNWLHKPVSGTAQLATATSTLTDIGTRSGLSHNTIFNGSIRIVVINALTSPVGNAPVSVLMRVSCPGVQFAEPLDPTEPLFQDGSSGELWYTNLYTAQAHVDTVAAEVETDLRVTMGEEVSSAKALMQRTTRLWSIPWSVTGVVRTNIPLYPLVNRVIDTLGTPEPQPDPLTMCVGDIPPSVVELAMNLTRFSFVNWFRSCYAGVRGGMEYRLVVNDKENATSRVEFHRATSRPAVVFTTRAFPANNLLETGVLSGCSGAVVKTQDVSCSVVKVPAYSDKLFAPGNVLLTNDSLSPEGLVIEVANSTGTTPVIVDLWANAADDFSLGWYLNPPSLFLSYNKPVCTSIPL